MDSDKLNSIFNNFQPRLATSDDSFMARLERNIRAAEVVKQQLVKDRRRNRMAIIMASITSFLCGILVTLFYPSIKLSVHNLSAGYVSICNIPESCVDTCILAVLGFSVLFLSYTVYDITKILSLKIKGNN